MTDDPLNLAWLRIDAPPDAAALENYRSDLESGLWNRWYESEDVDLPRGGVAWARRLSYEQMTRLIDLVRAEYR